ncbi:MAG: hypothetical protein CMG21_00830 [Candidatus Marinimicrobia bacterium]|nr:hypothetical protein [Candidatus Neomarinimicrobiota bacterium]|tara:strand:- start:2817 stop:3455 length:639 start_codon:yes stop_codon:yes gene_type:complete
MGINKIDFSFFFKDLIHASIFNNGFPKNFSNNFAIPIQTHSTNIKFVTKIGTYNNVDGLICSKKYKIPLSIQVADCVPIYIFDLKTEYYGILHSGWKGTKNKIVSKALNIFINEIKCKTNNIFIIIGPHIQKCCYEVDWDVAQLFSCIIKDRKKNKWLLNLNQEIKNDILKFGIPSENIYCSDICTYESSNFESFRRDGLKANRMLGIIKYV